MKLVVMFILGLALLVNPIFAQSEKSNGNSQNKEEKVKQNQGASNNTNSNSNSSNSGPGNSAKNLKSASSSGSLEENCDPSLEWKNHGAYVSCVAKLKQGGQAVSEAAKSNIGKKNQTGTPSASPLVSPTPDASSSATPSASVLPSPEATSSGLLTPAITQSIQTIQAGLTNLKDQFAALLDLLNLFN